MGREADAGTRRVVGSPGDDSRGVRPYRLGIVGIGLVASGSHIPAALALPDVEVTAFVDTSTNRAKRVAETYAIRPVITDDLTSVLDRLDGVVIASPNYTHCRLACMALDAGVHTLIEKPLATSVAEGQRIIEHARRAKAVAAVGYCTRFRDNVMLASDLLRSGHFGRVRSFAFQSGQAGGWPSVSAYTLSAEATGGGVVMTNGTHYIDRMLLFFGSPDRVGYADDAMGGPEAHATARFFYDRSDPPFTGTGRLSKLVRLRSGMVIAFDDGHLVIPEDERAPLVWRPRTSTVLEMVLKERGAGLFPPSMNVFQRQLRDFVDACRNGSDPMVSAAEGLESLRVIQAMYDNRSALAQDWYHEDARRMESVA
jgi:predicted dehydrogenase